MCIIVRGLEPQDNVYNCEMGGASRQCGTVQL